MPYCVNCGNQVREGARFCESCGTPVGQATPGPTGTAPPPQTPMQQKLQQPVTPQQTFQQPVRTTQQRFQQPAAQPKSQGVALGLVLGAAGVYVFTLVMTLIGGNAVGIISSGAMVAIILLAGFRPLEQGNASGATNGIIIAAVIALLFGFINIVAGVAAAGLINFFAAGALGAALTQIKK